MYLSSAPPPKPEASTPRHNIRGADASQRQLELIASTSLIFCILCASGCAAGSGDPSENESVSIFGRATYPLRAVLVEMDQKPVPLESLSIYASPASTVRRHLAPTLQDYHLELESLKTRQQEHQVAIKEQEQRLATAKSDVRAEYEARRPKENDKDLSRARNPLKELSKIRAEKSKADEWFQTAFAERIEPIQHEIDALRVDIARLQSDMARLRAGFNDRLFRALADLPEANRKQWKTKLNGETAVAIPNSEPWIVWSVCTHAKAVAIQRKRQVHSYHSGSAVHTNATEIESAITQSKQIRWMLTVPDDLVGGELHLDLETAFDQLPITVKFDQSHTPYLSRTAN